MKPKVYIDGQAGTTGLQIMERLSQREDLELLKLPDHLRHDEEARKAVMKEADLVFLCLPDAAAKEAVQLCDASTRVIDASTAHRTSWTYGFPELSAQTAADIRNARMVANPGCHATGMIALVYPLIQSGLLKPDTFLTVFSLTGYSGGGKKMIADYEAQDQPGHENLAAARPYALSLQHKHLPEMMKITGLTVTPAFIPVVDNYYKGMLSMIPVDQSMLTRHVTRQELVDLYADWYQNALSVRVSAQEDTKLAADALAGMDFLEIHVNGNEDQFVLTALFDNLGKGASGAAVQNMNLMLGLEPDAGLHLDQNT